MADRDGSQVKTSSGRGLQGGLRRLDEAVLPRLGRGARRLSRMPPLVAAALVGVIAIGGVAAWRISQPNRPDLSGSGSPVWVGVRQGDRIPAYAAAAADRLNGLTGSTTPAIYALVSLRTYLTPAGVTGLLAAAPAVTALRAYARVPLPGRQTEIVMLPLQATPEDLAEEMDDVADRKLAEADQDEQIADDLSPEPSPGMRQQYVVSAQVARAEAAAYRGHCACVYGLVVSAAPAELAALVRRPEVRIVDPAPSVVSLSQAVFSAPLPEQDTIFEPVPEADLASPTPTAAGVASSVPAGTPAR